MAWMSSLISILVLIFKNLPTIIEFIKLVSEKIKDITDAIDKKKKVEEIKEAVKKARVDKDTSKLEDLFGSRSLLPKEETGTLKSIGFKLLIEEEKKKTLIPQSLPLSTDLAPGSLETSDDPFLSPVKLISREELLALYPDIEKSTIDEPVISPLEVAPKSRSFGFSIKSAFGGNMSSGNLSASYKQRTAMNATRMGSKFIGIMLCFLFFGCKTVNTPPNTPSFRPKIYAGDSKRGGITRAQSNEFIPAEDSEFDEYLAMSYEDFSCFTQVFVLNCKEYKTSKPVCKSISKSRIQMEINKRQK